MEISIVGKNGMKLEIALLPIMLVSLANAQSASINTTRDNIKRVAPTMMSDGRVSFESLAACLPGLIGEDVVDIEKRLVRKMVPITLQDITGAQRLLMQSGGYKFVMPFTISGGDANSYTLVKQDRILTQPVMSRVFFNVRDTKVVGILMFVDCETPNGVSYFAALNGLTGQNAYSPTQVGVEIDRGTIDAMWLGNGFDIIGQKGLNHWGDRADKVITHVSGDPHEYVDGKHIKDWGRVISSWGTVNAIPFMIAGVGCPMIPQAAQTRTNTPDFYLPIKRVFDAEGRSYGTNSILAPIPNDKELTALLPFVGVIAVGEFDARTTKPGMDTYVKISRLGRFVFMDARG